MGRGRREDVDDAAPDRELTSALDEVAPLVAEPDELFGGRGRVQLATWSSTTGWVSTVSIGICCMIARTGAATMFGGSGCQPPHDLGREPTMSGTEPVARAEVSPRPGTARCAHQVPRTGISETSRLASRVPGAIASSVPCP